MGVIAARHRDRTPLRIGETVELADDLDIAPDVADLTRPAVAREALLGCGRKTG